MTQAATTQHKLASRSETLASVYRGLLGILMPTFAWVAPRWSRRTQRAIGRFLAWSFWKARPKYERAVCRNIAKVLGRDPAGEDVRRLAYAMHYNHAYFWIDLFHFSGKTEEEIERHVAYRKGDEIMTEALAGGRGLIIATAHLGNWELGGLLLGKKKLPVTVVYSKDRFEAIERFRSRARTTSEVKELAVSDSPFSAIPLLAALRRNEIVALQADRDWNDRGVAVPFFGDPAFFPEGPIHLALASGAPLIFCFIFHEPGMRYGIEFGGPLPIDRTGDRARDVRRNLERLASYLEERIRARIDQWYCYYPLWDDARRRLL
ncbi:MAG: lysophospholipid acyltransferase family protein [Acidobacteriota bacterium]